MSACPSGKFGCSCCCASVTGLRAGIHPDYIQSLHYDILGNDNTTGDERTFQLSALPIHIVSVSMSLAMNSWATTGTPEVGPGMALPTTANAERYAATPLLLSLLTLPSWTADTKVLGGWNPIEAVADNRYAIATAALNAYQPNWQSPPDLFGYFCDGGLYCEVTSAINVHHGARIVVNYIDRLSFSPAYPDPIETLQHYWTCAHGEKEYLDRFYTGRQFVTGSGSSDASSLKPESTDVVDPEGQFEGTSITLTDWVEGEREDDGSEPDGVPI